jgi:hypothetical protein
MAHSHDHDQGTYYIEQLCTIGVSAAVAGVCITMWWARNYTPSPRPPHLHMLDVMLKPSFHWPVLAGGIALAVLAVVRAGAVWALVGRSGSTHNHDHNHGHDHDHDHAHEHDHDHDHAHHHHEHAHDHAHEHAHDHTHDHANGSDCGHEHGFSPWRYIVLLVPVVLFFLGIPSLLPSEKALDPNDFLQDTTKHLRPIFGMRLTKTKNGYLQVTKVKPNSEPYEAGLRGGEVIREIRHEVSNDGNPLAQPEVFAPQELSLDEVTKLLQREDMDRVKLAVANDESGQTRLIELNRNSALLLDFNELEKASYTKEGRDWYQGRMGRLRGQFAPAPTGNSKQFTLFRLRMQCCAADAVPIKAMIVAKDSVTHVKSQDWVEVEGQILFLERRDRKGEFLPVLNVLSNDKIRPIDPEPSLYLQ